MAVVISDFEVVSEPASSTSPENGGKPEQKKMAPHEVAAIVRRQLERALRTWAH
jgi:hypothetical protein